MACSRVSIRWKRTRSLTFHCRYGPGRMSTGNRLTGASPCVSSAGHVPPWEASFVQGHRLHAQPADRLERVASALAINCGSAVQAARPSRTWKAAAGGEDTGQDRTTGSGAGVRADPSDRDQVLAGPRIAGYRQQRRSRTRKEPLAWFGRFHGIDTLTAICLPAEPHQFHRCGSPPANWGAGARAPEPAMVQSPVSRQITVIRL